MMHHSVFRGSPRHMRPRWPWSAASSFELCRRGGSSCRGTQFSAARSPTSCQRVWSSSSSPSSSSFNTSVYAQLEARLPLAPIAPNTALQLLATNSADVSPALHHLGVVEHLVRVICGNACCLNPDLCLDFMADLLFPSRPHGLHASHSVRGAEEVLAEKVRQGPIPAMSTPLDDAAVRVALTPLHETLVRCVVVHLQLQLEDPPVRGATSLHWWNEASACAVPAAGENVKPFNSGGESAMMERGAALLLAFSVHMSCFAQLDHSRRSAVSASCTIDQGCACVTLACRVVRHLMEGRREVEGVVASHISEAGIQKTSVITPAAPLHGQSLMHTGRLGRTTVVGMQLGERGWTSFCKVAQRCWHWSILVCRATPMLSSRRQRAFAVDSLIESFRILHTTLEAGVFRCPHRMGPAQAGGPTRSWPVRIACAEVLWWLLTRCLPVVRDGSEKDEALAASTEKASYDVGTARSAAKLQGWTPRQRWTTELRVVLLALARDFAEVVAVVVKDDVLDLPEAHSETHTAQQGRLVEMMAAVAFRLTLQRAACDGHRTHADLTEVDVARRLLHCVLSLPLRIQDAPPTLSTAAHTPPDAVVDGGPPSHTVHPGRKKNGDVSYVAISEETWCRLACVLHCVLSRTPVHPHQTSNCVEPLPETGVVGHTAAYARFLRMGLHRLRESAAFTAEHAAGAAALHDHGEMKTSTMRSPSQPSISLNFVFTFLKSWRAWLATCPSASGEGWFADASVSPAMENERAAGSRPGAAVIDAVLRDDRSTSYRADAFLQQSPFSEVHQLSLWVVEAWAAALDVKRECGPIDVCALWSALVTHDAKPTPGLPGRPLPLFHQAMLSTMDACEQRLSRQCGAFLEELRNAKCGRKIGVCTQMCVTRLQHDWQDGFPGEARELDNARRWRPLFAPALVSHAGLRLLSSITREGSAVSHDDDDDDGGERSRQLPLSESMLEVLRRTIAVPLSREKSLFQLSMIVAYVEWCEAAAMHTGWCYLTAEDCSDGGASEKDVPRRDGSSPWWILSVEGFASASGLQPASDTVALVYLWCGRGGARDGSRGSDLLCRGGAAEGLPRGCPVLPYHCSWNAVSPLSPFASPSLPSSPSAQQTCTLKWLRQAVDQWTDCYSLRVLLFFLQETAWQRQRMAHTEQRQLTAPSLSLSAPHRKQRCSPHGALTTTNTDGFVQWNSEALQPLLRSAARRLTCRMERLAIDVQRSSKLAHPGMQCSTHEARHEVTQLLCRFGGQTNVTRTGHRTLSHNDSILAALCGEDISLPQGTATSVPCPFSDATTSLTDRVQGLSQSPAVLVREVEDALDSLGLGETNTRRACCSGPEESGDIVSRRDNDADGFGVAVAGEAHALLMTLCAAPELTFLVSPRVLHFMYVLWDTCWACLLQLAQDDTHARKNARHCPASDSKAGDGWHRSATAGDHAELDALVTCRVMLHATRHLHVLAAELVEYACTVYIPALKASTEGAYDLVTTPMEALTKQLAARDTPHGLKGSASSLLLYHSVSAACGRGERFCFSSSSLRTYEVLCIGCFGKDERRQPCVWQRWMQELAFGDARLQEHHLVHWPSRFVPPLPPT